MQSRVLTWFSCVLLCVLFSSFKPWISSVLLCFRNLVVVESMLNADVRHVTRLLIEIVRSLRALHLRI